MNYSNILIKQIVDSTLCTCTCISSFDSCLLYSIVNIYFSIQGRLKKRQKVDVKCNDFATSLSQEESNKKLLHVY